MKLRKNKETQKWNIQERRKNMQISEVSERFAISQDTLRYYERIGLIPQVNRTSGGIRDYNEEDIKWIQFSFCMRKAGLSIEALIEYVNLFGQGDSTIDARKNILISQRDQLVSKISELEDTLKRLNQKITNYDNILLGRERDLAGYE
jgi:DNA-binding transcriptional MerR regulator